MEKLVVIGLVEIEDHVVLPTQEPVAAFAASELVDGCRILGGSLTPFRGLLLDTGRRPFENWG